MEDLDTDIPNVTHRYKRKRPERGNDELSQFMCEMKSMFKELKGHQASQDSKMEKISLAIEEIKSQSTALQTTVDFLASKFDTIQSQINKFETERQENLDYIRVLEEKVEQLERHKRATCVEIKNIPCTSGETKQGLLNQVISIGNVLNTSLVQNSVRDIFRINTKDPEVKTIIVDFVSVLTKEQIIRKYKEYNKSNKTSKFSTETIHLKGPRKPVFISENLTPRMKRLLYLSKEHARSNSFDHCWVSNGKILMRKKEGNAAILIRSEQDLKTLSVPGKL